MLIGQVQPLDRGLVSLCYTFQMATIINDPASDPSHDRSVDERTGVVTQSMMVTPVVGADRDWGVVSTINSNHPDGFTAQDLQRQHTAAGALAAHLDQREKATAPSHSRDAAGD